MKKVTFLAAAIAFIGLASTDANAQTTTPQEQKQTMQQAQTDKKEKVVLEQLPEPVKVALKSDTYKDWTVGEIYKLAPVDGNTTALAVYEVTMTNAQGQKGTIKIDEKGGDASKE